MSKKVAKVEEVEPLSEMARTQSASESKTQPTQRQKDKRNKRNGGHHRNVELKQQAARPFPKLKRDEQLTVSKTPTPTATSTKEMTANEPTESVLSLPLENQTQPSTQPKDRTDQIGPKSLTLLESAVQAPDAQRSDYGLNGPVHDFCGDLCARIRNTFTQLKRRCFYKIALLINVSVIIVFVAGGILIAYLSGLNHKQKPSCIIDREFAKVITSWNQWSECNVKCGIGSYMRHRLLRDKSAENCLNSTETEKCYNAPCCNDSAKSYLNSRQCYILKSDPVSFGQLNFTFALESAREKTFIRKLMIEDNVKNLWTKLECNMTKVRCTNRDMENIVFGIFNASDKTQNVTCRNNRCGLIIYLDKRKELFNYKYVNTTEDVKYPYLEKRNITIL